jgi:hypothetical protein
MASIGHQNSKLGAGSFGEALVMMVLRQIFDSLFAFFASLSREDIRWRTQGRGYPRAVDAR